MEVNEQIVLINIFHVSQGLCNVLTPTSGCAVGHSCPRFPLDKCNSGVRVVHLQRRDRNCDQWGSPRGRREYYDTRVKAS